jgi:O-antigen/teichoic acid export membrane protein
MTATAAPERENVLKEIQVAVRHMAVYGIGNILVKALGFFMIPFYTHYLTPQDYGILEILDLSMSLFALVLNMGLTPALLRCYAAAETPEEKRKVISTACVFALVTGAITFLAGAAAVRPATALLFGPSAPPVYVLLSFSSIVLNYVANPPRTYLRALEASGMYTVIDTGSVLVLLVLNVIFIAGLHLGLAGVLWSSLIVAFLQAALVGGWAFYKAGVRFAWPHLERMLRFGVPLIFANVGLFVLNFSDRFFLQHLRSLEVVGIYALGYKFGYMMNYLVVQPFFVMWQSRMYSIHARTDHRAVFQQFFALFAAGLIFAGLAMSIFSPEIVRLMVEARFAASQNVIPVVVLAYIFYGLSFYAQLGLFLTDRTKAIGVIGLGAAAFNLAANYFLIDRYGMMGAAVATLASFALLAVLSYWRSQRALRLPLGIARMWMAMAVAVLLYAGCRWWDPAPMALALGVKVLVLAFFPALLWKTGILHPAAAATLVSAKDRFVSMAGRLLRAAPGSAVN